MDCGEFCVLDSCTLQKVTRIWWWQCENFDDANQALTEGKMLLELDHNNVIKYYDFFLHQEKGGGAPRGTGPCLVHMPWLHAYEVQLDSIVVCNGFDCTIYGARHES